VGDERTAAISAGAAAQAPAENFPVALRVLPARYRRNLMAVYRFARTVDDIGDEALPGPRPEAAPPATGPAPTTTTRTATTANTTTANTPTANNATANNATANNASTANNNNNNNAAAAATTTTTAASVGTLVTAQRLALLDDLDGDLARLYAGRSPRHEVIAQLAPLARGCGVPAQLFHDLIQANRQDQEVTRYQTFDDLVGYCELSANPVGRIVLHVFGAYDARRASLSDHVCTALQLAEHWQDVAEDHGNGRIYLPLEDLQTFRCTERDLTEPAAGPRLKALMSFQVVRASALLDAGSPLIGSLRGAARLAVAGYVAGGRAALAAIQAADHDVLTATPRPSPRRLAAELARAYLRGR
jgi:squalene synthase HpnC